MAGLIRRRRWAVVAVLALLPLLWGAFLALTATQVRADLTEAQEAMLAGRDAVEDGDAERAHERFAQARQAFGVASGRLERLPVRLARPLPVAGDNLRAVSALSAAGGLVAGAGTDLTRALTGLPGGAAAFVPRGGVVPLEPIRELASWLQRAEGLLADASATVEAVPRRRLLAQVDVARAELDVQLSQVSEQLGPAAALTRVLPRLLGGDEPRRYFLAAQNPAELRGTGGFIGAFAILEADDGRLEVGEFSPVQDLPNRPADEVRAPNDSYAARYDRYGGAGFWMNINMTPDFPSAAAAIEELYEHVDGQRLDGTIVVDPFAFAALLRVAGPADVPGVGNVTADEVVEVVASEAYGQITDHEERKRLLGAVAAKAFEGLLRDQGADPVATVQALGEAFADGHVLLHAADPEVQAALDGVGLSGRMLDASEDYLAVYANNAAANKVDFYAERTVSYSVRLEEDGAGRGSAAVTLANHAPDEGHPRRVLGGGVDGLSPGGNLMLLSVYCASDCEPEGFRRDLGADGLRQEEELGRPALTTSVRLETDERERLEWDWTLPTAWEGDEEAGTYRLTFQDQTTIRPTVLTFEVTAPEGMQVIDASPGMRIDGDVARWRGPAPYAATLEVRFARPFEAEAPTTWERARAWLGQPVFRLP